MITVYLDDKPCCWFTPRLTPVRGAKGANICKRLMLGATLRSKLPGGQTKPAVPSFTEERPKTDETLEGGPIC